ncbi:hypothetical protein GOP47_0027368 [Adiantum capillus-veneris]|nr:hypothetical protein GOP47_0027368 [Adiantum capillus-veneris]
MFGMRVLIALKEKGIPYEYHEEDLQNKSKLLLEANPIHKQVPMLIHNGKPICESLIIVQYIDEAWPSPHVSFLPNEPYDRAVARFWADYVDKKMYDAGIRIIRNPQGEQREQGKRDFIEVLETLDRALRDTYGGGPFFGGECIGLVDIALAPFLSWFDAYERMGEFQIWEAAKCPHLLKWAEEVWKVPSVKESLPPPHKVVEVAEFLRRKFEP